MQIAFLGKNNKPGISEAICETEKISTLLDIYVGDKNEPFPVDLKKKKYDVLISYLSPWIIPKEVLEETRRWNINFHPGPPEYPGIGCFNFAIFEHAPSYGATCHIMLPKVDSGKIIGVERFKTSRQETVSSLSEKTYLVQLKLFKHVIHYIETYDELPESSEVWLRKPYRREQLEKLATIDISMSKSEIDHIIRSTYLDGRPAPFIELGGYRFEYNPER